jgi:hypothetical protein
MAGRQVTQVDIISVWLTSFRGAGSLFVLSLLVRCDAGNGI